MTRFIRPLLFALVCVGSSLPTVVGRAADSVSLAAAPKTIWDPRVVQISATDDAVGIDTESEPRLQSAGGLDIPADDSLTGTYPKPPALPTAKPAAKPLAKPQATTVNPPASWQSSTAYNRAAYGSATLTPRALPPTAKVRQAGAVAPSSSAEPESVTSQEALPMQHGMPMQQEMPMQEGMPMQQMEHPLGSLDCDWGLHKPCDSCSCESGCGECEGCPWYRTVKWFAGADYLLINPRFSNPVAFQRETSIPGTTATTDNFSGVKYNYDYNSDFHVFAGYHTDCDDAWRYGFWHIEAHASASGTASGTEGEPQTGFSGPGPAVAMAGDTLTATSHVLLNMYDAEHLRRLDWPACDPCNCPGMEIDWSFGVRVAQFHRSLSASAPGEEDAIGEQLASASTEFTGAGPRVGFELTRPFVHTAFSVYASANAALLIGDFRERSSTTVPGVVLATVTNTSDNADRIIPNFEMTAGLRWQPTCCTSLTAGWIFEEFGNMASSSPSCTNCSATSSSVGSDVSFDGLTVRMEHCF